MLISDQVIKYPSPYIVGFPALAPAFHAYPELIAGGASFMFPNIFRISLNKITSC